MGAEIWVERTRPFVASIVSSGAVAADPHSFSGVSLPASLLTRLRIWAGLGVNKEFSLLDDSGIFIWVGN